MSYNISKKSRVEAAVGIDSTPQKKDIVKVLCDSITTTIGEDGKTFCTSYCPAHNDGKCILKWVQGTGYSNPFSKLKNCFGGEDKLMAAYWAVCNLKVNKKDNDKNTIHAAILHSAGFTAEENALTDWLNMIIVKNWALSSVECKYHRNMCKHNHYFSVKRICMMMFILGEVVETKITRLLVNTKAVGLYDGFTRNSTHYVALYASFIEGEGPQVKSSTHRIILLGVSPMIAINDETVAADGADETHHIDSNAESDVDPEEVVEEDAGTTYSFKFDANHHVHHFKTILKAYKKDNIQDFFVAFLSDNASVNRKTARLAGVPHLPCHNHTHALDVGKLARIVTTS